MKSHIKGALDELELDDLELDDLELDELDDLELDELDMDELELDTLELSELELYELEAIELEAPMVKVCQGESNAPPTNGPMVKKYFTTAPAGMLVTTNSFVLSALCMVRIFCCPSLLMM